MSTTDTEAKTTRSEDPGRPLSEDEKSLLKRILAEPLEFPIEFRSWLKNFFETVALKRANPRPEPSMSNCWAYNRTCQFLIDGKCSLL